MASWPSRRQRATIWNSERIARRKFLYTNGRKFVHALGQAYILDQYRRD
jgi:hypothetical protein